MQQVTRGTWWWGGPARRTSCGPSTTACRCGGGGPRRRGAAARRTRSTPGATSSGGFACRQHWHRLGTLALPWPAMADAGCPAICYHPVSHSRNGTTFHASLRDHLLPSAPLVDCCRRRFAACPQQLRNAGRADNAALFDLDTPNVTLANTCDFRCAASLQLQSASTASCAYLVVLGPKRHTST